MAASGNLFAAIPSALPDEFFETLATGRATAGAPVRIERIVSKGHASPVGFWYDQDEAEWVAVITGEARLRFEEGDRVVSMKPGDWINIRSHERHRVEWTAPDVETVWLAVFYPTAPAGGASDGAGGADAVAKR